MENKFKVGDMIKSPGNIDFRYGIVHMNIHNTVDVVIVDSYVNDRMTEIGTCYTGCDPTNWTKIRHTKKRKQNFIDALNTAFKLKRINNLDYIEILYTLKK